MPLRVGKFTRYLVTAALAVLFFSSLGYIQLKGSYVQGPQSSGPLAYWLSPPGSASIPVGAGRPPLRWSPQGPIVPTSNASDQAMWDVRALQVKDAFRHAYNGYRMFAPGYDELRPVSNTGQNNFNGWNVTMYDSLDTMLIMGYYHVFAEALAVVREGSFKEVYNDSGSTYAPFFETVIRYLGGLLSAYALSGEQTLLDQADKLATLLEPAFATTKGFPASNIDPSNGRQSTSWETILAEIGTCQLEWTYLAHASGNKAHFDKGNAVIDNFADVLKTRKGGMLPTKWSLSTGVPLNEDRGLGGNAGSGHEYLLKQYLLTGKTDKKSLEMYLLTTNEVLTRLLYITPSRELLYPTSTTGVNFAPSHEFSSLSCFFPGLLALGAHRLTDDELNLSVLDADRLSPEAQRAYRLLANYDLRALHLAVAESIATSCWLSFEEMPSGLGPEALQMDMNSRLWIDVVEEWRVKGKQGPMPGVNVDLQPISTNQARHSWAQPEEPWEYRVSFANYSLRPELVESLYVLWRVTGNPIWRQRGWDIFQALQRYTKTPTGFATLQNVFQYPPRKVDNMPSYFLSQTLKYMYLLFVKDDLIPLDKFVFNTEGHPFAIFSWSDWEKHKFDIHTPS